MPISKV